MRCASAILLLAVLSVGDARAQADLVSSDRMPDGFREALPRVHAPDGAIRSFAGPGTPPSGGAVSSLAGGLVGVFLDVPDEVDNVSAVVVSADGTRIVAAGVWTDVVAARSPEGALLWAHEEVGCGPYALDDRGGVVLVGCVQSSQALVLDAATGSVLRRLPAASSVAQVALSADGSRAFLGEWSRPVGRVLVVDTGTGALLQTVAAPVQTSGSVFSVEDNRELVPFSPLAVSPDGAWVAHADFGGLRVFNALTGQLAFEAAASWIPDVLEISADGSTLLAVYSTGGGRAVFHVLGSDVASEVDFEDPPIYLASGAVAADGASALVSYNGVPLFVAPGAAPVPLPGATVVEVQALGNGRAAVQAYEVSTRLVDVATRTVLAEREAAPYFYFPGRVHDGATEAGTTLEDLVVFNLADGPAPAVFSAGSAPEPDAPRFVAVDAPGDRVAVSLGLSGEVVLYRPTTFARDWTAAVGPGAAGVAFLPSGDVVVGVPGRVLRLDGATGAVAESETIPGSAARFVSATAGRVFAEARGAGGTVEVFDVVAGDLVWRASAPVRSRISTNIGAGTLPHVAVSPDGKYVLGVDWQSEAVLVFNVETEALTSVPVGAIAWGLAVSSDGQFALAVDDEQHVHLISLADVPTRAASTFVPGLQSGSVAYSAVPDGFWVAAAGNPIRVFLIDGQTGAVREDRALSIEGTPANLWWSPQSGLVVGAVGALQAFPGSGLSLQTTGSVSTSQYAFVIEGPPAQIAGPLRDGRSVMAVPGPDMLYFPEGTAVSTDADPAVASLRLTALGTPSRAVVHVRVEGVARASLRVEAVDALGRVVGSLHDGPFAGGTRTLTWAAPVPGVYTVRVGGEAVSARVVVVGGP